MSENQPQIAHDVFCSFLVLVAAQRVEPLPGADRKALGVAAIKQDLKALQTLTIEEFGKRFGICSQCQGVCGNLFQAVGVALPPTIREL
jgi:hypothetical protein